MRRLLLFAALVAGPAPQAWADSGNLFTPIADVAVTGSSTALRNANGLRVALVCTNTHASVHVRLGDSATTPTATTGVQLRAGQSITITSKAAIHAISEGANVTVACSEETR